MLHRKPSSILNPQFCCCGRDTCFGCLHMNCSVMSAQARTQGSLTIPELFQIIGRAYICMTPAWSYPREPEQLPWPMIEQHDGLGLLHVYLHASFSVALQILSYVYLVHHYLLHCMCTLCTFPRCIADPLFPQHDLAPWTFSLRSLHSLLTTASQAQQFLLSNPCPLVH